MHTAASTAYGEEKQHMTKNQQKECVKGNNTYVWRCTTCGYIYEGDPLPEHYICPVCGSPAPKFERLRTDELEEYLN